MLKETEVQLIYNAVLVSGVQKVIQLCISTDTCAIFFAIIVKVKSLSRVRLSAIPWNVAYQAPPPMEFSRPLKVITKYWT